MPGFLAIIPSWAWRWLSMIAIAAAFGFTCWMYGDAHGTQKLINYQAKEATEAVRIAKARTVVELQVVDHYIKVKGDTVTVTKQVTKEVTKYANTGYCLDAEFRRLHDAAARNTVPGPASGADDPSGAPTAAATLQTVTGNYAKHHACVDSLDHLQTWVRGQQAVK